MIPEGNAVMGFNTTDRYFRTVDEGTVSRIHVLNEVVAFAGDDDGMPAGNGCRVDDDGVL